MNYLKAFSIAGLLLGSISANAAVISLPSTASFDIRGTTLEDFTLGGSYTPDDFGFIVLAQGQLSGPNAGKDGQGKQYGQTGAQDLSEVEASTDPTEAFWRALFGAASVATEEPEDYIPQAVARLELGVKYDFSMWVWSNEFFASDQCTVENAPAGCFENSRDSSVRGSTAITFFDSSAVDVPVGPTVLLLAAGLAGLWLRKKKA